MRVLSAIRIEKEYDKNGKNKRNKNDSYPV